MELFRPYRFREEDFYKSTNQKQECLWQPCLLTDRDEISNLYRGPSINASYQVSVHFAEGFQRRRLQCEKLTDDRRRETCHLQYAIPLVVQF